jgi:hypothetical protein
MSTNFMPFSDYNKLGALCAASSAATGPLVGMVMEHLPDSKKKDLQNLLNGGGFVGIENVVDGKGNNVIRLVGVEREGAHLVFCTVVANTPDVEH